MGRLIQDIHPGISAGSIALLQESKDTSRLVYTRMARVVT